MKQILSSGAVVIGVLRNNCILLANICPRSFHCIHCTAFFYFNKKNKKDGKDQESIQPSTTPDSGMGQDITWESDKITIRHHKQEQEVL